MTNDSVIDDIRARMERMPIFTGTGITVSALPAPEDVPEGTWVYPHVNGIVEAVNLELPFGSLIKYAIEAPALGS